MSENKAPASRVDRRALLGPEAAVAAKASVEAAPPWSFETRLALVALLGARHNDRPTEP